MLLSLADYHRPDSLEHAIALLGATVRPLAGGTHLVASGDPGLVGVIDLGGLTLDRNEVTEDGALVLGAMTRLADLPDVPGADRCDGALLDAARTAWPSLGKRHLATVGGEVWASSQRSLLGPLLIATDATVTLRNKRGQAQISAENFCAQDRPMDALLTEVRIPMAPAGSATVIETVRSLPSAVPILGVVVHLFIEAGGVSCYRVAIGPGALSPGLLIGLTDVPVGQIMPTIVEDTPPLLSDVRASEAYRRSVLTELVRRATRRAVARASDDA